jgi:HEAT repeat protein
VPDRLPGVPTPAEKQAALRKLAKDAGGRNVEEKQRVVHDLTKAIREEQDPIIRAEIVATLGHYPASESDRVMKAAFNDPDVDVRLAACRAWGRRRGPQAAAVLADAMTGDAELDVRMAAARALGRSKDPSAVPALGKALEDPDVAMQRQAVLALRDASGKDFGNDVNLWRQYVQGETPKPDKPVSVAERFRKMF